MKQVFFTIITFSIIVSVSKIVIPRGKMQKIACIAISFIYSLALLGKLTGIKIDFTENNFSFSTSYSFDAENQKSASLYKFFSEKILEKEQIKFESVSVDVQDSGQIKRIFVKLDNSVIANENEHILLSEKVVNALKDYFNLEKEMVSVDE